MSTPKKFLQPVLSRATAWTAERVAALPQMLDVRQLLANAERLDEPELAAICTADMTRRRREALRASKELALLKPKPKKKKVVVEEA